MSASTQKKIRQEQRVQGVEKRQVAQQKAEKAAKRAKAEKAEEAPAEETAAPAALVGEFGDDSAAPLEDGSAPEGFDIKGNKDSMKFHRPDGQWYDPTIAEVWFRTPEAAEAAGFTEAGK